MIIGNKVILREKRLADARNDYAWEADTELAQLDASPIVSATFPYYLLEYASQLRHPSLAGQRFAIETLNGKHIGNCTYYNINETKGKAELGIMIGNRNYWDKGYGTDTVTTLVNHIFRQGNLGRIYLKTLVSNSRAQKCFQKCGFTPCEHLVQDKFNFVLMEISYKQWQAQETPEAASSREEREN